MNNRLLKQIEPLYSPVKHHGIWKTEEWEGERSYHIIKKRFLSILGVFDKHAPVVVVVEEIPRGSEQFHLGFWSSISCVENLLYPKKYVVWSTNFILPEYVVSFKARMGFRRSSTLVMEGTCLDAISISYSGGDLKILTSSKDPYGREILQ
ncbi:hypothetical protein BVC80_399g19 [Macleaya cordata]|uniref:Uncharacterized protein n=1 Tax=Macleaya cordata TaxID=56857 RepID=A0A200R1F4_MACCD|nr:hypothetical protein BVC80_399g19 [Macleaya cordata]